jgi:hypothetical protein
MSNNMITSRVDEEKAIRALSTMDNSKSNELFELVKRAYKPHPDPKDIEALRKWLDECPEIWALVYDVTHLNEKLMIGRMAPEEAAQLAIEKHVDEIRRDLDYVEATRMERMLIDNIVLSWLRWQWAEYQLIRSTGKSTSSMSAILFWERRLSAAQGRYLRACETLAKIRKLALKNPTLQVNIATQSGQQVNVAGDLIKK